MHTISCSNLPTHTCFSSQSSFQFLLLLTDLYLWMLIIIRPLSLLNIVHWMLHTFSYHFLTNALIGFWEQLSAHVTFGAFGQTLFLVLQEAYGAFSSRDDYPKIQDQQTKLLFFNRVWSCWNRFKNLMPGFQRKLSNCMGICIWYRSLHKIWCFHLSFGLK